MDRHGWMLMRENTERNKEELKMTQDSNENTKTQN